MYMAMFFTDISLFYLIPLVISVVLYTLIAVMLLYAAPRTLREEFKIILLNYPFMGDINFINSIDILILPPQ